MHYPKAVFTVVALVVIPPPGSFAEETPGFHVVGYLPEYRLARFDGDAAGELTDLIYFSAEATAEGDVKRERISNEALAKLRAIKKRHALRLSLAVGGWQRSAGFAEMAASEAARERFADHCVQFCTEHDFDGIDLDWEHPNGEAQEKDYGVLLATLKKAFAPRRLLLTVAVADWQALSPEAIAAVDRIHLMAYDAPGRHSTFDYAVSAVHRLRKRGVPDAKICLGIPFYGRRIDKPGQSLTYAEIVDKYQPPPSNDEVDGIYFNGQDTVERKTRFALDQKLGGVMIWELGQDAGGERSLLRAIRKKGFRVRDEARCDALNPEP